MHKHSFPMINRTLCFDQILRLGSRPLPGNRVQSSRQFLNLKPKQTRVESADAKSVGGVTQTDDALIRISDVTKHYAGGGPPALDRVSLAVAAGEAVAVMGPS